MGAERGAGQPARDRPARCHPAWRSSRVSSTSCTTAREDCRSRVSVSASSITSVTICSTWAATSGLQEASFLSSFWASCVMQQRYHASPSPARFSLLKSAQRLGRDHTSSSGQRTARLPHDVFQTGIDLSPCSSPFELTVSAKRLSRSGSSTFDGAFCESSP